MKNTLKLLATLTLFLATSATTSLAKEEETDLTGFTINIKGKVFSCVEGGALCRCTLSRIKREPYLAEEYTYDVEKYDPKTKKYTSITTLSGYIGIRDSKFQEHGRACQREVTEPHCLFQ